MTDPRHMADAPACFEKLLEHAATQRHTYEPGQVVVDAGTPADAITYVHRGRLHVYKVIDARRRRLSRVLGPGEWNGIDALTGAGETSTLVVAAEKSVVWQIPAGALLDGISGDHACAVWLVRQIAERAVDAEQDAARVAFEDCRTRLIGALERFSTTAAATSEGADVRIRLTHSQLADAIGAARETVSLMLSEMRRAGVLRTGRNHLLIDLEKLKAQRTTAPTVAPQS